MFQKILSQLKSAGRYRSLSLPNGIDLTSNDYLGMAAHEGLRRLAIDALSDGLDVGAAGSRLLRGHTKAHQDLEDFAASHFAAGACLYFSSGFQANYAVLTTLPRRGDVVVYDSLVHASMRDGLKACDAKAFKFAHNDANALEDVLKRHREKAKNLWIAVESVYSMDGDVAPLDDFYVLAEKYNAYLIIDEAHGTGVFGDGGRGVSWDLISRYGYDRIMSLHTCGKAIGVAGGLVCASDDVISYMINAARPFIYSTAPMPLQAILVQRSLEMLAGAEGDVRRKKLMSLCKISHEIFGGEGTQIVPIILGSDERAVFVSQALQKEGFDVRAIRPPTVPEGTARLRLSLSSALSEQNLRDFASCYKSINK